MKPRFHRRLALAKSGSTRFCLAGLVLGACLQIVGAASAQVEVQGRAPAIGSPFAIADFDGDRLPDLASVQVANGGNSETQYWIRFQLSTGARQSIGITAPVGGLQLASRDVNGDNFLDVVVTTALLHRPVAVLLNDGHGNFALKDPAAFSEAIWTAETRWTAAVLQIHDAAFNLPPRFSPGDSRENTTIFSPRAACEVLGFAVHRSAACPLAIAVLGRAPPTFVHHV